MADHNPIDKVILMKIGLTDSDLTNMQTKFHKFVESLDPAQRKSLKKSTPTAKEAAATLGPEVTPQHLEAFIRAHAPRDASVVLFNGGNGNGDGTNG
jgi:type IV secretory pathway ATPase VirB11/archaellum biosynthesis ATPase